MASIKKQKNMSVKKRVNLDLCKTLLYTNIITRKYLKKSVLVLFANKFLGNSRVQFPKRRDSPFKCHNVILKTIYGRKLPLKHFFYRPLRDTFR